MAIVTKVRTAVIEVSEDELAVIRKALKAMQQYAGYDTQEECNIVVELRKDLA